MKPCSLGRGPLFKWKFGTFAAACVVLVCGCAPVRVGPQLPFGAIFLRMRGTDLSLTPGTNAISIYEDTVGPSEYRAATPNDAIIGDLSARHLESVNGEACRDRLVLPLAALTGGGVVDAGSSPFGFAGVFGRAGFAEAFADAYWFGKRISQGRDGTLVDVRADVSTLSVLGGLFVRQCLNINAYYVYSSANLRSSDEMSAP